MLFNSLSFAVFLPIVFLLYWLVFKKTKSGQDVLLLISSYVFYGWWDYRFLFLLCFSTLLDYFMGLQIDRTEKQGKRKALLLISVITNLGFLGFFKYYNFFAGSFAAALQSVGVHTQLWTLNIILPVGISFYTFHGLSYVFDIYNRKFKPDSNFVEYSLFVSFFPLLVAGPIERATHLLPQIQKPRSFDYKISVDGMRQILWGLFKKIVIADNCAQIVNEVFAHQPEHRASTLVFAAILFAFQIYCDFSGYSDIALGTAKLFGFDLIRNFNYPYFSRNVAEFWRRWHISLTTWFRDYVYIPMGGSRGSKWEKIRNTIVMFVISGFWHGANWTFLAWGLFNGLLFLPLLISGKNKNYKDGVAEGKVLPSLKELFQMVLTFSLITIGWILFRAKSISQAWLYFHGIFSRSIFTRPELIDKNLLIFLVVFLLAEWVQRTRQHALQIQNIKYAAVRWGIYLALVYFICSFSGSSQGFIYFQF